jgi:hypothetical protein
VKSLEQLHDATLKRIELDWAEGRLRLSFIAGAEDQLVVIIGEGLFSFSCDRKFPWGRSESVNKINFNQETDSTTLTVEMQSGDLLVGKLKSFQIS